MNGDNEKNLLNERMSETVGSQERQPERSQEYRDAFFKDECRVVHSFGFRRLQGKMQVLGQDQGDFHRTRMTHSLEVASISRSILAYLRSKSYIDKDGTLDEAKRFGALPTEHLITAIGLLHDIGHPPFGHQGEMALNYKMHANGGFEGNAQTLHALTKLEPFTEKHGLDLTRRTLLGILKYPIPYSACKKNYSKQDLPDTQNRSIDVEVWKPPKCYFDCDEKEVNWLLEAFTARDQSFYTQTYWKEEMKANCSDRKTLDCTIMDIADDITNAVHDVEDAVHLKLLCKDDFDAYNPKVEESPVARKQEAADLFNPCAYKRKEAIGKLIHDTINSIRIRKRTKSFSSPQLQYCVELTDGYERLVKWLKALVYTKVIQTPEIQTSVYGGSLIVMQLFDALESSPGKLLPKGAWNDRWKLAEEESQKKRVICDFIASMTDDYAYRMRCRLFGNDFGSVFDRLY